jgi:hypothetical protein
MEESKVNEETDATTSSSTSTSAVVSPSSLEDDIQKSASRVMNHMNMDHADSLKAYVLAFGTPVEDCIHCESAILTGLDRYGFILEIIVKGNNDTNGTTDPTKGENNNDDKMLRRRTTTKTVRVPYDRPLESAKELHQVAVRMHLAAYNKLGVWYKIRTGYYSRAFKMIGSEMNKILGKAKTKDTIRTIITKTAIVAVGSMGVILTMHLGYMQQRKHHQRLLKGE